MQKDTIEIRYLKYLIIIELNKIIKIQEDMKNTEKKKHKIGIFSKLAGRFYRKIIRPISPSSGWFEFSGVKVSIKKKLFDGIVPSEWLPMGLENIEYYEQTLVSELKRNVRNGDKVIVVGGGLGVTAIVAAKKTGCEGSVICYEGSNPGAALIKEVVIMNQVQETVSVVNKIVGNPMHIYGNDISLLSIGAEQIPKCDVLELDCEGSESGIIENLIYLPRTIIVETHGIYNSPTTKVKLLLEERGYQVRNAGVAEPRVSKFCEDNDIMILVGELSVKDKKCD